MNQPQAEVRNCSSDVSASTPFGKQVLLPDLREILHLAAQGMRFAPTTAGMTRSDWVNSPDIATNDLAQIKCWVEDGFSLVTMARWDGTFAVDVDDWDKCIKLGMPDPGVNYWAKSASSNGIRKRCHGHGIHDETTRALGCNIIRVPDPDDIEKAKAEKRQPNYILELKLNRHSVAAPTAHRFGQKGKNDGVYTPFEPRTEMVRGLSPEFLSWIDKHGSKSGSTKPASGGEPEFAEGFDTCDLLDHCECTEDRSGMVNGMLHVVPETCPDCGRPCGGSTVAAAKVKFMFGDRNWGFSCKWCGADRHALEAKFGEYEGEVYAKQPVIVEFDSSEEPKPAGDPNKCYSTSCNPAKCVDGFPPEAHATVDEIKALHEARMAWTARHTPAVPPRPKAEPAPLKPGEVLLSEKDGNTLVGVKASAIETEPVEWWWPGKLPKGVFAVNAGKPDSGKSVVAIDWVATITTGRDWPDGEKNIHGPKMAVWAGTEDDPKRVLVPRMQAAGVDLDKVIMIKQTTRLDDEGRPIASKLKLDEDLSLLARMLKAYPDIALIVLDPLPSYYGSKDGNKDADLRPMLERLRDMCEKYGVTLVGIMHLNKRSDANSTEKIKGAGAVVEIARVVWGFSRDADDKELYHMAKIKGNLSKKRSGIDYRIEDAVVKVRGEDKIYPKVVWGEENEADADDQLAAERDRSGERRADRKRDKAMEWLLAALAEKPLASEEVFKRGAELGFSKDAIYRAKAVDKESGDPRIHCWQAVRGGQWFWSLKKRSEGVAEVSLADVTAL